MIDHWSCPHCRAFRGSNSEEKNNHEDQCETHLFCQERCAKGRANYIRDLGKAIAQEYNGKFGEPNLIEELAKALVQSVTIEDGQFDKIMAVLTPMQKLVFVKLAEKVVGRTRPTTPAVRKRGRKKAS